MANKRKTKFKQYWVGIVMGKIDFYKTATYYGGVLHADLFRSRRAAKLCYEEVRPLTKRECGR